MEASALAASLERAVAAARPALERLPDPAVRPRPGAWSPAEVLGHLVDSAVVNYARFVRASSMDDLVLEGYDQDAWVAAGRYASADWPALVALWAALNLQLARLVAGLDSRDLQRPRARHTLDRVAWQTVPASEPATLTYLVEDYVGHLKHHLAAILS